MKGYKHKIGATLVEILIVVAIIAILATMVVGIATRIDNQSKEQLTKNTFALLNAALGQFRDYGYNYNPSTVIVAERDFYRSLDFPLDCTGYPVDGLQTTLSIALGGGTVQIRNHDKPEYSKYSGSEVLYFFLSRVPESRQTLDKIDSSLITNLNDDGAKIEISIGDKPYYPLLRIIDPWGTTLHYDYYPDWADYTGGLAGYFGYAGKSKRTFPEIISAGPDRIFGTGDDISNRKK